MIKDSLTLDELKALQSNDQNCLVGELCRGVYIEKKHHTVFDDLARDIRENGIETPLRVVGDRLVDGHHRAIVAIELGLGNIPITYEGPLD